MKRLNAIVAAAALLGGCVLGPNFRHPPTPAVAAGPFVAATGPGTFSSAPPPPRWWHLYDDPVLDRYIETALSANTDLRTAVANLDRARGLLIEARGARLPSTTLSASGGYVRSNGSGGSSGGIGSTTGGSTTGSGTTGGSTTGTGTTGGTGTTTTTGSRTGSYEGQFYSTNLDVRYELDLFGRVRRSVEAARADYAAIEAARDVVRVSVAAETTRAYADACAAAQQLAVAKRTLALQNETYALTERLYQAGRDTPLDTNRAHALVEQTRATLPTLAADQRAALYRLAVLIGQPPELPLPEAAACMRPPRLTVPLPVGDGTALLQRRPDIRQADRTLAAATARIGVATAALYPQVTLGGSIGNSAISIAGLGSSDGLTFNVGPALSWTFPNVTTARARIIQARASNAAALASFDGTVLGALRDTETSLSDLVGETERYRALAASRTYSAEAARIVRLRYSAGRENFLAVLDADRTLANAEAALAQSEALLSSDQIAVFKQLGGGWDAESMPAAALGRAASGSAGPAAIGSAGQAASGSGSNSASAVRN